MDDQHAAVGPHTHGEHGEIHLPPPSYWPVVMAIGITAALAGIVINTFVWIAGVLIILVALSGWMIELGRDLKTAPDDYQP
jgi:cytochrome c oxidase subunit 1